MSRALPSRRLADPGVRSGTRCALVAALLGGLIGASSAQAAEPTCGPFAERYPSVPGLAVAAEQGVTPGKAGAARGGAIVSLPEPPEVDSRTPSGEALLALPKAADGSIPTNFELAPGAHIAASFFSPVLCATVARVVGPAKASPRELVPSVPDTATVVPNTVYVTAQAEVVPASKPDDSGPDRKSDRKPDQKPDPYRPLQWGYDQSGVAAARSLSNGSGVRIAVLDSAPDAHHRDLALRVEALDGGPEAAASVHGTLVAGVIDAIEGNGFGMAGLAPGASLLAVPVCTPIGATAADRCVLYDLLRGVDRAWAREAQIVNLSIVGPPNPLLERAMARLDELGVLVVASAGNEGTADPRYPAAYPSVIGVGASDRERRASPRSNRGISAELLAPGVEVLSAVPGDAFAFGSGTSLAAAHVSGVLGVLIGAGADAASARQALFQQAHEASEGRPAVLLPPVCDVLARLGRSCNTP